MQARKRAGSTSDVKSRRPAGETSRRAMHHFMQTTTLRTNLRTVALGLAVAGFTFLYLAAHVLTADLGFAGVPEKAVRSCIHFVVYGALALALVKALRGWYLLAWLISVVLATGEEARQLFIPYRFGSISDWMINLAGITCFLVGAKVLRNHMRGRWPATGGEWRGTAATKSTAIDNS